MTILGYEQLIEQIEQGSAVEYLFFWGPEEPGESVSRACLCQWYPAPFDIDGITYATAEHFMMAEKARLFGDEVMRERIIASPGPGEVKMFGRHVRGFDERLWQQRRFEIVVNGNVAKFSQNPPLRDFLLGTGDAVLVEASPVDAIWGIGLPEGSSTSTEPASWKGSNLLGFALMAARAKIRGEAC